MKRACLTGALSASVLAGCAGDGPSEAATVVERDSAGIRIIENAVDTAALRAGWSIDPEPFRSIGGVEAEETEQLYRIAGGVLLEDGRIVVANAGSADIRIFGPAGTLDTVFGREGDGPGEYRNPSIAGRGAGDTIVVFDAGLRRITMITPEAGEVRSFEVGGSGGGFPLALGTLPDGSVAIGGGMAFSSAEGFPSGRVRPTTRHVIVGPDGGIRTDFGDIPAVEMFAEVQGGSFRARRVAFGKVTASEPASSRLWIGTGESWELRAYGLDGNLERIVRFDRALAPVTSEIHEQWMEERLEDLTDPNEIREERAALAELPAADAVPPYQTFVADRLDNLWIGEVLLPGQEARTWTVIDPDGRAIGRLTLPVRTLPLDIHADRILGVTSDELDVESLTVWRLGRPAG